ncbi:MAG: pyrimidine operon attenuation protein/uracil phosphoribosyltransferase [Saprospiraceae bacterium]|jgi:pyrimidine operon attenuation protein/uracil phosphoribosyltransferase
MPRGKIILNEVQFGFTIKRLCHELIEEYDQFDNCCIIGIQDKGTILSDRIMLELKELVAVPIQYGKLDISFHRDDYRRRKTVIAPSPTEMDFIVEEKRVVLVDDVLYTGRSVHAAMSALQQFGRPKSIELLTFVDRRFNRHFPIQADYFGIRVDAIEEAYVQVEWKAHQGKDQIKFFANKEKS